MKAATLNEIKKELAQLEAAKLIEIIQLVAKYKRENKDYLSYVLFDAHDQTSAIQSIKKELDEHFAALKQQGNLYYVKKGLRKILRLVTRYCKYINEKGASVDLHIYFCNSLKNSGIPYHSNKLIVNLYAMQVKKINSLVAALHEDMQGDYSREIEKL